MRRLVPLLAVAFTAAGCAGPLDLGSLANRIDVQPGHIRIRGTDEAPAGGQPSTLPAAGSEDQSWLTALQPTVRRIRGSDAGTSLRRDETIDVLPGDQVVVEGQGRALVVFPDHITVGLAQGAALQIVAPPSRGENPPALKLKQTAGEVHAQLNDASDGVVIETGPAVFSSLAPQTELLVCQTAGGASCIVVLRGKAQVVAGAQRSELQPGQAATILAGRPLATPVCADLVQVGRWLDGSAAPATADMATTVAGWPAAPCPTTPLAAGTGGPAPTVPAPATAVAAATVGGATATVVATSRPPAVPSRAGMVQMAAGHYTVGATQPDAYQRPAQDVQLPAYWIDQYLATNAQYKTFVDQTGHPAPPTWSGNNYPADAAKFPVQGLTYNDAQAYCAWQGKRLPGEAEWEAAGRGAGANPPLYPWGADQTAGGQTYQLPETNTYEVGSLPWNKSQAGVYDLLDNLWQWVDQPYAPISSGLHVVRGGRYGLLWDLAHREVARADDTNFANSAGVRCAASHVAGE